MGTQIESAAGHTYGMRVSKGHRAAIFGPGYSIQAHIAITKALAFQAVSGVVNVATAGAYGILALRNDDPNRTMLVTYIRMGVDRIEALQCKCEVLRGGTWVAGTATTPVNTTMTSQNASIVLAHKNSIPTGSPGVLDTIWIQGPDEVVYNKEGSVVIPLGGILALRMTTETDAVNIHGRVSFLMLDNDLLESF